MFRTQKFMLILTLIVLLASGCAPATTTPAATEQVRPAEPTAAPQEQPTKAPEVAPTKAPEVAPTTAPEVATQAPAAPVQKDLLVIAQSVDPRTIDPHETTAPYLTIVAQICEPLIFWSTDENGSPVIQKQLATDYQWLDDRTIQFNIRKGVSFSNGEPLNAEAAKVSIELLFSAYNYSQWLEGLLDHVDIVDDYTINIVLTQPSPLVESVLAQGSFMVAPKDYETRGFDEMVQSPVGTGPYVFNEHVRDDHITLDANPNYWDGTPLFKQVVFKIIPDDTARVAALEAGEVDIATFVPLSAASRIEGSSSLKLQSISSLRQFATFFNTDNPKAAPLHDANVRLALNYAIDRAGMCKQLFDGRCTPTDGQFLLYNQVGYNPALKIYPYDPELAKKMLADAGYADGFEVDYTYTVGRYPQDKQAGEAIASYLRAVGLTVNELAVDYAEWARQFDEGQSTALYTVGFNFGLDGYLSLSSYIPGKRFRTSIMPSAFDEAVLAAGTTIDQAQRIKLLQDAEAAINKEPFAIYLYSLDDLYGVQNQVEGFKPRSDQTIRLIEWAIIK